VVTGEVVTGSYTLKCPELPEADGWACLSAENFRCEGPATFGIYDTKKDVNQSIPPDRNGFLCGRLCGITGRRF